MGAGVGGTVLLIITTAIVVVICVCTKRRKKSKSIRGHLLSMHHVDPLYILAGNAIDSSFSPPLPNGTSLNDLGHIYGASTYVTNAY